MKLRHLILGITALCVFRVGHTDELHGQVQPFLPPASLFDTARGVTSGFRYDEAEALAELCTNLNESTLAGHERPAGWTIIFEGLREAGNEQGVGPFNNAWKLWKKLGTEKTYALVFRERPEDARNLRTDLFAETVPARRVQIQVGANHMVEFTLGTTLGAEVHAGFAYSLAILMMHKEQGILNQLKQLPNGSTLFLTGHGLGGALASLSHAFLHYAINDAGNRFGLRDRAFALKSYAFAQPKPGNWQFAMDFARLTGPRDVALVINNTLDWMPQVPLSLGYLDDSMKSVIDEFRQRQGKGNAHLIDVSRYAALELRGILDETVGVKLRYTIENSALSFDPAYQQAGKAAAIDVDATHSANFTVVGHLLSLVGTESSEVVQDGIMTQHRISNYRHWLQQLRPAQ